MSQKTKGIYQLLLNPQIYNFSQYIMSGTSFRKKLVEKLKIRENSKILDIGCGTCKVLDYCSGVTYYGYDTNLSCINYAKNKYGNRGVFKCKKITSSEIKILPKFDYVFLFGIIHHLDDNETIKLFKLLRKVLSKNGQILSEDPVIIKKQNFFAKFFAEKDRGNHVRTTVEYVRLVKKVFKYINWKITHQLFIPYTWFVMRIRN